MSKYILYGGKLTRSTVTEMVMIEAGLEYEFREIDIFKKQHKSDEYIEINPAALVPSLVTPEGEILYETPAINLYLAEHHGVEHLVPLVGDPDRGPFLSALFFVADELEPVIKRYFYPHRYVFRNEDTNRMKEESLAWAMRLLGIINQRLGKRGPYSLGQRFSLVDLTLSYWMGFFASKYSMEEIPHVMACHNRVISRELLSSKFEELDLLRSERAKMKSQE